MTQEITLSNLKAGDKLIPKMLNVFEYKKSEYEIYSDENGLFIINDKNDKQRIDNKTIGWFSENATLLTSQPTPERLLTEETNKILGEVKPYTCDKCLMLITGSALHECQPEQQIKNDILKPIKAKPHFYSVCLLGMQGIARDLGYNLVVHGSMDRDLDLVAIAWVDEPKAHLELIHAFCEYLGVFKHETKEEFSYSVLPGKRDSYVINLNRGSKFNSYRDEQYYLDISFTPQIK